jgi:heme-degrading monooxygenase HmoA
MITQFVKFESALTEEEALAICEARKPQYLATPGLIQKYYLKLDEPNHYGGFFLWESREAMAAFRESELGKTIASAYKVVGTPHIEVHELMFPLRPEAMTERERAVA